MLRLNLKVQLCREQCYDGASVRSGIKNGVAKLICDDEPRAVYTHCYGHALNLAVHDTLKQCRTMKSCLKTVNEIVKLVKNSPKRDVAFQRLKQTFLQKVQALEFYVLQDGLFVLLHYKAFWTTMMFCLFGKNVKILHWTVKQKQV